MFGASICTGVASLPLVRRKIQENNALAAKSRAEMNLSIEESCHTPIPNEKTHCRYPWGNCSELVPSWQALLGQQWKFWEPSVDLFSLPTNMTDMEEKKICAKCQRSERNSL